MNRNRLPSRFKPRISALIDQCNEHFIQELDQISLLLQQQERYELRSASNLDSDSFRQLNERLGTALKFYQNAGRVWENSLKSLDDLEVDTSESWMRRHDLFDVRSRPARSLINGTKPSTQDEIRVYEDDLQVIMEGIRQASTEAALTETFQRANAILGQSGHIEKCQRAFLQDSLVQPWSRLHHA